MLLNLKTLRIVFVVCALSVVSACGSRNLAGPETSFSPASESTLLIASGIQTKSSIFGGCHCPYFIQIEDETEKPIGRIYDFHSHDRSPDAYVVPPGHYAMTSWDDCVKRVHIHGPNLGGGLFVDRSKISFKDAYTLRFTAKPGEILYLGHFDGHGFRDKSEDVQKLLSTMPNVSGPLIFRSPKWDTHVVE